MKRYSWLILLLLLAMPWTLRAQIPSCQFADVSFNTLTQQFQYHCPNTNTWTPISNNGGGGGGGSLPPGGTNTAVQVNLNGTSFGGNTAIFSADLVNNILSWNSSTGSSAIGLVATGPTSSIELQSGATGQVELLLDSTGGATLANQDLTNNLGVQIVVNDSDNSGSLTLVKESSGSVQTSLTLNSSGVQVVAPLINLGANASVTNSGALAVTSCTGCGATTGTLGQPAIYTTTSTLGSSNQTVDASAFAGATWAIKVNAAVAALGSPGGTIIVPDSIAGDGLTTTINLGTTALVNLQFPGTGTFKECGLSPATYSHISLGSATLQANASNCTIINQTNTTTLQTVQKFIVDGGVLDCNNLTACTGIADGNHTNTLIHNVSIKNASDSTSTISTPTGGMVFIGTQFAKIENVKFYNDYVPHKCYNISAAGGCNSNYYDNILVATGCKVGVIYGYQGTTFQTGPNYFKNPTIQNCGVSSMAVFGNPSVCSSGHNCPATMFIDGGAPEVNGGTSSVTIDGFTISQSSTYLDYTYLVYQNVDITEATIPTVISANDHSIVCISPAVGYGDSSGAVVAADATSNTYTEGCPTQTVAGATYANVSSPNTFGVFNGTPATSGANQSSPAFPICGFLWTGSVSAQDCWQIQTLFTAGANPTTALTFTHPTAGGSGFVKLDLTAVNQVGLPGSGNPFINTSSWNTGSSSLTAGGQIFSTTGVGPQDGSFGSNMSAKAIACETSFAPTSVNTGSATTTVGQNCLPANSVIDAVVYRVTTAITTAANFTVGQSGSTSQFCSTQSTLTLGATGTCVPTAYAAQASAAKVVVTFNGTPGAGALRLIVYYHIFTAPTS